MAIGRFHKGVRVQRGRGIGSLFGGLFRAILPVGKKILKSSATRALKQQARKAAINIAADALEGKNVKQSAKERLQDARKDIAKSIRQHSSKPVKKVRHRPKVIKRRPVKQYALLS